MTPRGRPAGAAQVRTGHRVCAVGRLLRSQPPDADAHSRSAVGFLGSAHQCASLVSSAYDVSLTGRPLSAASATTTGGAAHHRARLGRGLPGPQLHGVRRQGLPSQCGCRDSQSGLMLGAPAVRGRWGASRPAALTKPVDVTASVLRAVGAQSYRRSGPTRQNAVECVIVRSFPTLTCSQRPRGKRIQGCPRAPPGR
jgi:hypothetical protein